MDIEVLKLLHDRLQKAHPEYTPNELEAFTSGLIQGFMLKEKTINHGTWGNQVLKDDGFGGKQAGYICPVCKQFVPNKGNFCLNCGADMRSSNGGKE